MTRRNIYDSTRRRNRVLTTRQEVESITDFLALGVLDHDGVAGVVSAGTTGTDIRLSSKNVDKLAFALVTPLGAETVC